MSLRRWARKLRRRQITTSLQTDARLTQEHQDIHRLETLEKRELLSASPSAASAASDVLSVSAAWFAQVEAGDPQGSSDALGALSRKQRRAKARNPMAYSTLLWQGKAINAVSNQLIVKLTKSAANNINNLSEINNLLGLNSLGAKVIKGLGLKGMVLIEANNINQTTAIGEALADHSKVDYVSPNHITATRAITPNDRQFKKQWGLNNPRGFDVNAPEAWEFTRGDSDLVVGVIDSGVDYTHPDLMANMWTNPGETPDDGIDNDGNGFIDDVYGYDFVNNDGDPFDDLNHGTHVAGTIAATGDNNIGVSGVAPNVKIMAIKILGGPGDIGGLASFISNAVSGVNYATMMRQNFGVNMPITNNSWGFAGTSQPIFDAVAANELADMLFVAAAGNTSTNNDLVPDVPTSFNLDNVVSVGAMDARGRKANFSSYGATDVDLFAPGVHVLSTVPPNPFFGALPNGSYAFFDGTSMASPHVAGVAALLKSFDPSLTTDELKAAILAGATPVNQLQKYSATGGMVNALASLQFISDTPNADLYESNNSVIQVDAQTGIKRKRGRNRRRGGKRGKRNGEVLAISADFGLLTNTRQVHGLNMVGDDTKTDWYRFEMNEFGGLSDEVAIKFDVAKGDLTVELYDGDGVTLLGTGVQDLLDPEKFGVSMTGFNPGVYYVKVEQIDNMVSPGYVLTINPAVRTRDAREDNNTHFQVAAMPAGELFSSNLGPITRPKVIKNLNTLDNGPGRANDFYQFEILADADKPKNNIRIKFLHKNGDLDMRLYNAQQLLADNDLNNFLRISASQTNSEFISLQGLPRGKYFLRVTGVSGATNPNYTLVINPPKSVKNKDRAGNTPRRARNVGRLLNGPAVFEDYVGAGDERDIYRVNAGADRTLTAVLTGVTGPVIMNIFSRNDLTNPIQTFPIAGGFIAPLSSNPGVYYLVVAALPTDTANYTLTLTATPVDLGA